MLTLTPNAAEAVTTIVGRTQESPEGGLRISEARDPEAGFELGIAPAPEPTDAVVEVSGARVFLDEPSSAALENRLLDAEIADDGGVKFAVRNQA